MKRNLTNALRNLILLSTLPGVACLRANADPVPVRQVQGTIRGFLELLAPDGRVVAGGDYIQTVHGERVTTRTFFTFKDGSVDDETAVFTQHRVFQLISDHRVQKGPSFPHPMDMTVDARSGQVTIRTNGKDGKDQVYTDHLDLPPDVANGIVPILLGSMQPSTANTTLSMVVPTPKPRLVTLVISSRGEDTYTLAGSRKKAIHYNIKIDLGGVAGLVAPIVGKAPPDIQVWMIASAATTFAREIGPLYQDGPMMTIQLASPAWQEASRPGR